jgi:hypothetical protein
MDNLAILESQRDDCVLKLSDRDYVQVWEQLASDLFNVNRMINEQKGS